MPDTLDMILSCLHFAEPTSYAKMWAKIEAFSDEEIKGIWDAIQSCLSRGCDEWGNVYFDRKAYWDREQTITLEDWEEAIYSAMGQRGISAC